ncbi:hypothetical protein D3C77_338280 [compost metagenome]
MLHFFKPVLGSRIIKAPAVDEMDGADRIIPCCHIQQLAQFLFAASEIVRFDPKQQLGILALHLLYERDVFLK